MSTLRRVETHVRVMAERQRVLASEHSVAFPHVSELPSAGRFEGFTRVHIDDANSNDQFFTGVVEKLVTSAAAGQSHTILVCGAQSSGRSQTVYDVQGAGLVHMAADALLRMHDVAVHFTSFYTRGNACFDSFTGQRVECVEKPAPVGLMPMSGVRPLNRAKDAVVVPAGKKPDWCNFIQFQVYKRITGSDVAQRRDSFGLLTFVDVSCFEDALLPEQAELHTVFRDIKSGRDPDFTRCLLTQLLQQSIAGSRALTVITAVTGKASTTRAACHALQLALDAGRIEQLAPLCQSVVPKWFDHLPSDIDNFDHDRQTRISNAYQRGVASTYDKFRSFIESAQAKQRGIIEENEAIAAARARFQTLFEKRMHQLQPEGPGLEDKLVDIASETKRLRSQADEVDRELQKQKHRAELAEMSIQEIHARRADENASHELRRAQLEQEASSARAKTRDIDADCDAISRCMCEAEGRVELAAERARRAALIANRDNANAKLAARQQRLEAKLVEASEKARVRNEKACELRQRRSVAAHVSHLEARVRAKADSLAGMRTSESRPAATSRRRVQSDLNETLL